MIYLSDVNECETGRNFCDVHAFCNNTVGSYHCACRKGFNGSGFFCEGMLKVNILDKKKQYFSCLTQWLFKKSVLFVVKKNILWNKWICAFKLVFVVVVGTFDTSTSSISVTQNILFLSYISFADINECVAGTDSCDANAICYNTFGNYSCACNDGFSGIGQVCQGKCVTL